MAERFDFDAGYGAEYDRFIRRVVPGYDHIFPAGLALLSPHVPAEGRVLVVGAGSGSELATFAQARPGWRLTGVDPAAQMIAITRERLERLGVLDRVTLHQGVLRTLPAGEPFDAATLGLVLHFVPDGPGPDGKLGLLREIASRLRPGGALVLVDGHGDPKSPSGRIQFEGWMAFLAATGMTAAEITTYRAQLDASVRWADERRLMALLETAGFVNPVPFYRFFVFGGWVVRRR